MSKVLVSELIEKLCTFDMDSEVHLSGDWYGEGHLYVGDYWVEIDVDV